MTASDVLVLNVGSSTVKAQVVTPEGDRRLDVELEGSPDEEALASLIERAGPVLAVGHRLVHGGPDHVAAELVTDDLLADLDRVVELAPLHLPPELDVVRAVRRATPDLPAVVCFDTAFHATLPPAAHRYAVPAEWEALGLRRYGFHGLSHAYVARRAAEVVGRPVGALRTVSCHLGAGASLAAIDGGRSVDTTMGLTPLAGLVMATRPGELDPGAVPWLVRLGVDLAEVEDALWHRSGLAGLTGGSGDLREVLAGADAGDERCLGAVDVMVHRLRREISAMVAALGGVDVIAFTGGVGERSPRIRSAAVGGLGFLGAAVDPGRNEGARGGGPDTSVAAPGSAVEVVVVHAREDLEIARQVRAALV